MRAMPQDSHQCFDAIANHGGVVLFLGRSDAGKSTRIQELVGLITGRGGSVAVLDADVGQSTYGLPTTLTLVHFSSEAKANSGKEGPPLSVGSIRADENIPFGQLGMTFQSRLNRPHRFLTERDTA